MPDADLLIIGGGIAGWSAAYFATRRGRHVTLIDEGVHRASDVPIALVNPLRGHAGRLVPRGVEGMAATFDLIDRLRAEGHAIAAGRGLHRPLLDLQGELLTEPYWRTRIAGRLAFDFAAASPLAAGLVDRPPSLFLPQAGWVAAPDLLAALAAGSGVAALASRAELVARDTVRLADGTRLRARTILWCGGAWGAHGLDPVSDGSAATVRADTGLYKPGSLAATPARLTDAPLTFGLYVVPWGDHGTLVGPTHEDTVTTFPIETERDRVEPAIARLQDRVRRLFGTTITLTSAWRGVRLARLSRAARAALQDVTTSTALGSRGFLMAPLLASEWAASL